MSEIHVSMCHLTIFQNEAILGSNLPCLLPIGRDYGSINIACAAESALAFPPANPASACWGDTKEKIISRHYSER